MEKHDILCDFYHPLLAARGNCNNIWNSLQWSTFPKDSHFHSRGVKMAESTFRKPEISRTKVNVYDPR